MNVFRLALLGLLIFFVNLAQAADDLWLTDLGAAQKMAKEQDKPLLLDFTGSDWCGWCIKLHKEVFSKSQFTDYAKDKLILLQVDFPQSKPQTDAVKAQNSKLQDKYQVQGYPTIVVLSPDGKKLGELGYEEGGPDVWLKDLQAITK